MARSPTSRSFAVFTLNPLPSPLDARLVQKLVRAEPATIGHFRNWGFMDPAIRAMQSDLRIAGPAVTVRVPGVDGTIVGYALGQVRPGDVVIADECGIVVLDPKDAEAAAERAIGMQDAEVASRKRLDAGEKLPDISGATKTLQEALAKQNK